MKSIKPTEQQQAFHAQAQINGSDGSDGNFASGAERKKSALALNARDSAAMAKSMGAIGSAMIGKTPSSDGRETGSQAVHAKLALKYSGNKRDMELEVLPDSGLEARGGHYGAAGQAQPARKTRGTKKMKVS